MEATRERKDKEENKNIISSSDTTNEVGKTKDTVIEIICESIVEREGDDGNARKQEDILAFSRTVRKIDSSLE
ncbi:unnamed protein product [Cochlearia groenlandica]